MRNIPIQDQKRKPEPQLIDLMNLDRLSDSDCTVLFFCNPNDVDPADKIFRSYVNTAATNPLITRWTPLRGREIIKPLYRRALAIREKALGPDHPDVAMSLDNLAELYRDQGKYDLAEPLYLRALAVCEKALGPDHPNTKIATANLAALREAAKAPAAQPEASVTKVSRDNPCPCGSGKRYKHCHGALP